jgi:L-ribulose-5-phosphate 4-epimerase
MDSARYDDLRTEVCRTNRGLANSGLVVLSFGNVSGVDRAAGVMAIKPSGIDYGSLTPEQIVVLDLASGEWLAGTLRPSSDAPTHLELYRSFPLIGGVVHTHSPYASAWAQARRAIPCLGTTHADYVRGPVPVTRLLTDEEIATDYERNTGLVIAERYAQDDLTPEEAPAVLVAGHGAFTWGSSPSAALDTAIALEHLAAIATHQAAIGPLEGIPAALIERHFSRKHGPHAYYGQPVAAARDAADGESK